MVAQEPLPDPAWSAVDRHFHHRYSVQSVAIGLASRFVVKNVMRAWAAQPNLHWPFESVDRLAGLMPAPAAATVKPVQLDDCTAECVQLGKHTPSRAILYLHGGAFLTCGLNTHRSLAARLARAADAVVLNVNYRMLPAHRISDAVDDGLTGLRWLRRRGYRPERIVVAGDSAGGYLAFMTTLAAIRARLGRPAGVATISPFTDADLTRRRTQRGARRCAMFPPSALSAFTRYLRRAQRRGEGAGSTGEIVSPVDADLRPLPPVTIHASSDELLRPDAESMADRLEAAQVPCDLHLWEGQIHDFPMAADVLPEGRRALHYIGDFVKDVTRPVSGGSGQAA